LLTQKRFKKKITKEKTENGSTVNKKNFWFSALKRRGPVKKSSPPTKIRKGGGGKKVGSYNVFFESFQKGSFLDLTRQETIVQWRGLLGGGAL